MRARAACAASRCCASSCRCAPTLDAEEFDRSTARIAAPLRPLRRRRSRWPGRRRMRSAAIRSPARWRWATTRACARTAARRRGRRRTSIRRRAAPLDATSACACRCCSPRATSPRHGADRPRRRLPTRRSACAARRRPARMILATGDRARSVRVARCIRPPGFRASRSGSTSVSSAATIPATADARAGVRPARPGSALDRAATGSPGALADHLTSFGGAARRRERPEHRAGLDRLGRDRQPRHGQRAVLRTCRSFRTRRCCCCTTLQGSTAIEAYWKSVAWPQQGAVRRRAAGSAVRAAADGAAGSRRRLRAAATARLPERTAPSSVAG